MFAISRSLQHRWDSVHRLIEVAGSELANEVRSWSGETGIPEQGTTEDATYVALAMRESPALVQLLHSDAGLAWLENDEMRTASAEFVEHHRRDAPPFVDPNVTYDVFISHLQGDEAIARQFADRLREIGHTIFLAADSISLGEKRVETLERALQSARSVLFLQGEGTSDSAWQQQEVTAAISRPDLIVIPVILPGQSAADLPPLLQTLVALHLPDDSDEAIKRSVQEIAKTLETRLRGAS
jgi:hypothetical protein